ncbi:hypothetical protein DCAR_0206222 [Daucus carota subsp. sativus]|uniref:non-specific serine/threonine protein kinase n=1 Tax=Daucus carota subsp. sativus TaxID=79200 RepID=A0AAF1ANG2_DAUCS|nr:PREDICTED: serine/threonine-protein kinase-like protein ACR4 [Daucus carota subsp. sativus]WOG87002.1 hypothetical protein DCAR_0206222 [Daucus carota subsp. sativus]
MTDNSNGIVILITLLNILVYKLQKLQEAQQTKLQEASQTKLEEVEKPEVQEAENTDRLPLSVPKLCRRFSLLEMQSATNNFQEELVIGKGGFGNVYKGIVDFGEREVAIKRLKSKSRQGIKEFHTEIEMFSRIQHSHSVSLIGYCDDSEEMILVYDYMSCGNLADHLHKRVRKGDTSLPSLTWLQRLKISIGAAHGLDYLHTGTGIENRVIHRDIKSSNILLDENLAAKISDFGLSKIGPANQTCTYISTRVKGTTGYIDPYYVSTHRLTSKTDVYAFGVVLAEILCGRPAVDTSLDEEQINLAGWAQDCYKEGLLGQIIDLNIKGDISNDSLNAYVGVAIKCLHPQPKHRPTMAEVVVGLESALKLQIKSTHYSLVEIMPVDYTEEDANVNQEHENTEEILNVSSGERCKRQSSVRITFTKRISGLFSGTARGFSAKPVGGLATGPGEAKAPTELLPVNKNAEKSRYSLRRSMTNNIIKKLRHISFLPMKPKAWDEEKVLQSSRLRSFSFNVLSVATRHFHSDSKLGEGGFGSVYKGWVDTNTFAAAEWGSGLLIAVKRLHRESTQGAQEWLAEIRVLEYLCHPNLVNMIGYCLEDKHRLLVYEFMPQGSLEQHLFGRKETKRLLNWPIRYNIISGIARGILYLHEGSRLRVIHRDLKASNVLLDSEMNPKISDFGLARIFQHESEVNTNLVVGTFGYMAPEYAVHGRFSAKSDVYSFGVLVLEIISGIQMRGFNHSDPSENLITRAWRLYQDENCLELLDKAAMGSYIQFELFRVIQIGLLCVQPCPEDRPSMSMVVEMLNSDTEVPQPKEPDFINIRHQSVSE